MIRFVFGRPGYGKTHEILEAVRTHVQRGERAYLIVPEQEVYSCERDLLAALPSDAGRFFEIMSFSRLCEQIAGRYGGRTVQSLTPGTRSLLMWQTLRDLRGLLVEYRAEADIPLTSMMLSAVDELSANSIAPEQLEEVAANAEDPDSPLARKLHDLALIQATYHGMVSDLCGDDPSDSLLRAAATLDKHDFFENSFVYIDSFTSFTAQEYTFLRNVFRQANGVTVTLGAGDRHTREIQFESIRDTAQRLSRLASDVGKDWEDRVLTEPHRHHAPELRILERDLWNLERKKEDREIPEEDGRGHVRLIEADTPYDEAEAAALHVLEAVENGVPYGEIAIIVRDFSLWNGVLDATLEQYGIPYFVSVRTDLNTRPAARLLPCALRCLSRRYQANDVMALLKTGLCGVEAWETDLFEEYVHTWKLSGNRMLEDVWSMNPDGFTTELSPRGKAILDTANRVRKAVIEPLQTLSISLKAATSLTDQCRALYAYLEALSVRGQLTAQAGEYLKLNRHREAGETARLWPFLCEALASMATTLPETPLSCSELETALALLFAATDIGSVPLRHDCVTVGSASLLRVSHVKTALLLGLCDGEFPAVVSDQGIFSEQDKLTLESEGIELNSRAGKQSADELLYVYRAMTTPEEDLILSRSRQTADGRALSPSSALNRVQFLLPYLTPERFHIGMVSDPADAVYERLPSLAYDGLPRHMMPDVLGTRLWLSQGKLQTYFRCPFSYYGKYVLNLREPAEARIGNAESGNFLHHVLERFLAVTLDEQNRIRPLTEDEINRLADDIIERYLHELYPGDLCSSGRMLHVFSRMRTVVLSLLYSIVEELRHSSFTPIHTEWSTYRTDGSGPSPMVLHLDEADDPSQLVELILGGIIDRVDLYRKDDQIYIRVIDYKSSHHDFSEASLINDMNVQLLLYLFMLCSPQNRALFTGAEDGDGVSVIPASAVYMSPSEDKSDGHIEAMRTGVILNDEEVLQAASPNGPEFLPGVKINKSGQPTGKSLYSAERMSELEIKLQTLIRDTAARLYGGCANRTPSEDACQFCPMRSGCYLAVTSHSF